MAKRPVRDLTVGAVVALGLLIFASAVMIVGEESKLFRTKVNYMVRGFDHVHIVLDNDDGIAGGHQLIKHTQQFADVIGMQPGGRFIENINRFSSPLFTEFP